MPPTFTSLLRFELQAPGEGLNTWGATLNTATVALIDFAIGGSTSLALSGPMTLTTAYGATDQARSAILNFTSGSGGTVTIPALSKVYHVRNNVSGGAIFTTGSGTTATVEAGSSAVVICDGTNCYRFTDAADVAACLVAAKAYTDAASFAAQAGTLPGQAGNAGAFLQTNGSTPSWQAINSGIVTGALGFTPQVHLGYTPLNAAANLSDVANPATALGAIGGVSGMFLSANYSNTTTIASTYAPLASPTLTGTPTVPTAAPGTNTTQAASTAFVAAAVALVAPIVTVAQFRNQQTSGTGSGEAAGVSLTANAWSRRTLNTTVVNTISGASLSGNQVALPAGTYEATAQAQGSFNSVGAASHKIRLLNATDSVTLVAGINTTAVVPSNAAMDVTTVLQGRFTLSGAKTIELDSYLTTSVTSGGQFIGTGEVEVYVDLYLRKVA